MFGHDGIEVEADDPRAETRSDSAVDPIVGAEVPDHHV